MGGKTDKPDAGSNPAGEGGGNEPPAVNPPADNNKRLAALEASVAALVPVLAEHGIAVADDETEVDQAVRLIQVLDDQVAELREGARSASEDLEKLKAEIEKAKAAGRQVGKPKAKSSRARKLGGGTAAKPFATDREALIEAMGAGEGTLELVFSNGAEEIIELAPLELYPAAFRRVQGDRFKLNQPVLVKGSRDGTRVRGFALVKEGKQLAYEPLPEAVPLPAGQERKFEIVF